MLCFNNTVSLACNAIVINVFMSCEYGKKWYDVSKSAMCNLGMIHS